MILINLIGSKGEGDSSPTLLREISLWLQSEGVRVKEHTIAGSNNYRFFNKYANELYALGLALRDEDYDVVVAESHMYRTYERKVGEGHCDRKVLIENIKDNIKGVQVLNVITGTGQISRVLNEAIGLSGLPVRRIDKYNYKDIIKEELVELFLQKQKKEKKECNCKTPCKECKCKEKSDSSAQTPIKVLALFGKSGSGKSFLLNDLTRRFKPLNKIVSHTTRPARDYEVNGKDYHFVTPLQMSELIANGKMLEATEFREWFYGTSIDSLDPKTMNIGIFNPEGVEYLMDDPRLEVYPVFIDCSDKLRLIRSLEREENPDVEEIIRRYGTDNLDFAQFSLNKDEYFTFENKLNANLDMLYQYAVDLLTRV